MIQPPARPLAAGRRRRLRATSVAVAVAVVGLVVAGCSIPTDENAKAIDDVPDELFTTTTLEVESVEPEESGFTMSLYFYNDQQQLVLVERPVAVIPRLSEVLAALGGLTEEEQEAQPGLRTTLLADSPLTVSDLDRENKVLVLTAGDTRYRELGLTEADRRNRIFSQVVCTMTAASSDIDRVRLVDPEGDVPVQNTEDGTVIDGPVSRANVNDCITAADLAEQAVEEAEQAEEAEEDGSTSSTTAP